MECRKGEDKRLNLWNCEDKIRDSRFWICGLSTSDSKLGRNERKVSFEFRVADSIR
jgi:hypothetical protein